jgi:DNA-binding NtrC family response regulator
VAPDSQDDILSTLRHPVAHATGRRELALRVVDSPDAAMLGRFCLAEGASGTFGRRGGRVDVRIDDATLSREHMRAAWDPGRRCFAVEDMGSRNGVFVNGRKVSGERVRASDLVRIGDTLLVGAHLDPQLDGWSPPADSGMVGRSGAMRAVVEQARQIAREDVPVLVLGETGVGKELVARYLHAGSRLSGAFVPVNCASFTAGLAASELFGHVRGAFSGAHQSHDGLFVAARGGTLFLDEIGEMELGVQAQLLRAVEDKAVRPVGGLRPVPAPVRLVAAANADLARLATEGKFRHDLLARLAQWVIRVPPLRERREDIPALVRHFVQRHAAGRDLHIAGGFMEAMALAAWPENVRGLASAVRAVLVRHSAAALLHEGLLPPEILQATASADEKPTDPEDTLPEAAPGQVPTRSELERLMRHYRGCVADVARHLGRKRMQVYRWIARHEIDPKAFRP